MRIAFCRGVVVWVGCLWETSLQISIRVVRRPGNKNKMEELGELGVKITEVFGNVSWNKESLEFESGSVGVYQYLVADRYFILATKKSGGLIRVRCL